MMARISDTTPQPARVKQDPDAVKARIKDELVKRRLLIEKHKRNTRLISALLIIICLGIAGYILFVGKQSVIVPKTITSSAQFPILYPEPSKQVTIKQSSFRYDKSHGQVYFIVNFKNYNITFAEQSSPDSFSADPTFYTALVQKLNGYATFAAVDGRVDLSLPAETHEQTAIMNARGTLLFASTRDTISESNWKLLLNTLH